MRRKSLVIGVTVIGLLAGYVYATPYITLFMLQRAMEMKNAKDVEKFIDFPDVRDSLRSQYSEYIKEYVKGDQQDVGLAAFTAGVGNALAGTFIDLAIQPSNLQKWLDGNSIIPDESTGLDISLKRLDPASSRVSMGYLDLETFEVRFKESGPFKSIVFERRNLVFWKIIGLKISAEIFEKSSSLTQSSQSNANYPDGQCNNAIEGVKQEISKLGSDVTARQQSGQSEVFDLELQGRKSLHFTLGEQYLREGMGSAENNPVNKVMGSNDQLQGFAKKLFSTCRSVGKVSFGMYGSDWIENYAYSSKGILVVEKCSHDPNDIAFKRRATYVDHPEGPSLNGSCTYIYL